MLNRSALSLVVLGPALAGATLFACSKPAGGSGVSNETAPARAAAASLTADSHGTAGPASAGSSIAAQDATPRVIVDSKGFTPSRVTLPRGKSGAITFVRTVDKTCATKVVFPELGIQKDLPLNQPVTVNVPTTEPKSYGFQCGMGMYKSAVVVQ